MQTNFIFMVLPLREVTVVVQSPSVCWGMSLRAAISGVMQTFMAMAPPEPMVGMARYRVLQGETTVDEVRRAIGLE